MERVKYQNHEIRRWDVGPSTFLVSPEQGAKLLNWHVNMSDGSVRDVIHWPEENHSLEMQKVQGGIPILFPFAGKCYHEGRENHWKLNSGEIVPMPLHGFARDMSFEIRSIDVAGFEAVMVPKNETKKFYPYEYTFSVIYHFLELTLQISLILENEGREPIPWSAGLHPYFQVPWRKGLSLDDHQVMIKSKKSFQYMEGGMLEKKPTQENGYSLGDKELINKIFYELEYPKAEISLLNGEETLRISEVGGAAVGSRLTFVTWTQTGAPYFCVEPWMSPPNAPENNTTRLVPPSGRDEFTIEIELV